MKRKIESGIQQTILKYLAYKRLFHWRNNSGAMKTEHGGFIRFGAVGSPDIFVVANAQIYGLEVKAPKGKQSEGQVIFQEGFEKAGGIYVIVTCLEDVQKLGL